jgi:periplasmic divalent cation tolerance protein
MNIVLSNVPEDHADRIARAVVEAKLAACVNALPVKSYYVWKGALTVDREVTLLMKVGAGKVDALRDELRKLHPYELPEIVVLDVDTTRSLPEYVDWVRRESAGTP